MYLMFWITFYAWEETSLMKSGWNIVCFYSRNDWVYYCPRRNRDLPINGWSSADILLLAQQGLEATPERVGQRFSLIGLLSLGMVQVNKRRLNVS